MGYCTKTLVIVVLSCLFLPGSPSVVTENVPAFAKSHDRTSIVVNVQENLERLLVEEDTDGDKKITINDGLVKSKDHGDQRFWLIATNEKRYEVTGTYFLSNLLEELRLQQLAG